MHTVRKFTTIASATFLFASGFAVTPALATPGNGFTPSGIVSGSFGPLDVNNQFGAWHMDLEATPATDVGADRLTVAPGGASGWHSHPSAVFVTVTQGTIHWLNGSDPLCGRHVYTVGQSFIEDGGVVHNVRNASRTANAEFIAIHINPTGTSGPAFRIDKPAPTNCKF